MKVATTHRLILNKPASIFNWLQECIFRNIDGPLLLGLMLLASFGLICLYSASGQHWLVVEKQLLKITLGFTIMAIIAQIPPRLLIRIAPTAYLFSLSLLIIVLFMGYIGKGAQRWFNLGLFHLQPSELLKIALPLMLCRYLEQTGIPPSNKTLWMSTLMVIVPFLLVCKQPDLGTGMMLIMAAAVVFILGGLSRKIMVTVASLGLISCPIFWHLLHHYQQERILTFLNPERDPLGSGYHIIQSKIAIGSGGLWGKGWLTGTQSHLNFLPEHTTDFIFAVAAEEFGLVGCILVIALCLCITARIFHISYHAQSTFTRLLAGSLGSIFFLSCTTNIGMVVGLLPIVGVPLPLISYGGSNLVTTMMGFGIIMSIHGHRRLIDS